MVAVLVILSVVLVLVMGPSLLGPRRTAVRRRVVAPVRRRVIVEDVTDPRGFHSTGRTVGRL
jgi:hypothetical protein